jgi:hypothetical protein
VVEKSSELRGLVCGRKLYAEFKGRVEPLIYSFLGICENYVNYGKV